MKIKWLGQSGYILYDDKNTICIDPYLSDVVNRVANRPRMVPAAVEPASLKADAVICTHNHLDHIDIDAIPLMEKSDKVFLSPADAENQLRECGVENYVRFDEGMTYNVGDFEAEAVYASHSVPAIGVIIKHQGITLYFSGDTYYDEKLEELKNKEIDVMFICINGKLGNMNVQEAVKLTEIVNPKVGVPNHYGMFESNTEDPSKYTLNVENGFEMEYNKEYDIKEVLKNV